MQRSDEVNEKKVGQNGNLIHVSLEVNQNTHINTHTPDLKWHSALIASDFLAKMHLEMITISITTIL